MQVATWPKSHYGREENPSLMGLLCAGRGVVVVCVCPFSPTPQAGSYLRAFAQATSSTGYTPTLNLNMAGYIPLQPA